MYRDELMRVFVDVEDTQRNRDFFLRFREGVGQRAKKRFFTLNKWRSKSDNLVHRL